ncbi:MAG: hypothetical protein KDB94_13940, partial [Acidobacteria bacterium]|nr:hypothetical protein [Acidobacteriota bacterium]
MGVGGRVFGFRISSRPGSPGWALGAVALAAALLLVPGLAVAATINVTTTQQQVNTDADCSLQEAIFAANFNLNVAIDPSNPATVINTGCTPGDPGTDTIVLAPGAVYEVSGFVVDPFNTAGLTATPLVMGSIVLEGNGARLER